MISTATNDCGEPNQTNERMKKKGKFRRENGADTGNPARDVGQASAQAEPAGGVAPMQCFDFQHEPVRVILRGCEPWFVAVDVCRVLEIANSRHAVGELDDDEKGVATAETLRANVASDDVSVPNRGLSVVSESGLFALIFKSRKAQARKFRKWVTSEVLPAIRRQGRYELYGALDRSLMGRLEGMRQALFEAIAGVDSGRVPIGKAQTIAHAARVILESIKLEGEAIGYENVFKVWRDESGRRVLQSAGAPETGVQDLPQGGLREEAKD